jgi:hypothetical protein
MGFFEDKLAATGRVVDSAMDRAMGSSSPGAFNRRAGDMTAWVRDRAELLDDAFGRRGIRVSSLKIGKGLVAAMLLFVVGWSVVQMARTLLAKPPAVVVTPAEEARADALSARIVNQRDRELQQSQMTLPTASGRRGGSR